jgi:hypothetical protein
MKRYFPTIEHGTDLVEFMYHQNNLDLRGQPLGGPKWFCATMRDSWAGNIVVAGLVCEFKNNFDVHFSTAVADPGCISRRILRGVFQSLFSKAVRITALVDPRNAHSNNLVLRMGFVYEGFLRMGLDGFHDANLYGMLRQDCKYLPGVRAAHSMNGGSHNEQPTGPARSLRTGVGTTVS